MRTLAISTLVFIIGFSLGAILFNSSNTFATETDTGGFEFPAGFYDLTGQAIPRATPTDHLKEDDIEVYNNRVILNVQDAIYARFTPTASMDPVLDEKSNAIEIVPTNENQINEGDIIAYESKFADGIIIHRVIKKGEDQLGTYYIVKGDNNPEADPGKVRFEDIKSVVVAIIY